MIDAVRDQTGAVDERDIVGDGNAPAGFRAADGQFLYLRLRVESDPMQGPNLRPFAWGFAFSTDGLPTTYEVLISLDGASRQVNAYRNSVTTIPDSPTDPADLPPVSYPFATHGRVRPAPSTFGGDGDFFIDLAMPWATLAPLGLSATTPIVVWAASSTSPDQLNGDFACHDAQGAPSVPSLSGAISSSTTATPPAGAGPSGGLSLEGGPGCNSSHTGGSAIALLLATFALAAGARRRRGGS